MYPYFKRFFDLIFSIVGIFFTGPLIFLAMIILYLTGEKKPLFIQLRVGKNRQLFRFYKLRTMRETGAITTGPITLHGDDRITTFGKFLRWSKIDEFPQFFNVFSGDLSFVGPRPLMPETFYKYDKSIQKKIGKVPPGITGAGSVFFRNEAFILKTAGKKNQEAYYLNTILPYKGQLEEWYAENTSFMMDLKLLFFSALVIIYSRLKGLRWYFKNLPESKELDPYFN